MNIEIGDVRYRPESVKAGRTGVGRRYTRNTQIPLLEQWKKAGGSIDYLTIDHAVMMRMGDQSACRDATGKTSAVAGPPNLEPELVDRAANIPFGPGPARAAAEIARAADMRVIFMVTPGAYGFGAEGDSGAREVPARRPACGASACSET